jgi:ABC-2 type transport system permease protein
MTALAGTAALIRLFLHLDRVRLPVWVVVLGIVPVGTAGAFQSLYASEASRLELAATVTSNPAFTALLGPLFEPSIGGLTAWRVGTLGAFLLGLMAVLTMARHTRDDEESGRRELLGSTVVARHAPLAAALTITMGAGVLTGAVVTGGLIAIGLETPGSIAFGASFAAVTATFATVGAVAAQVSHSGSAARGVGVGIVGLFFVVRMAGDAGEASGLGWLSWSSPIGWIGQLRPFAEERWWVFVLWAGLASAALITAVAMQSRRDVGEGALPPRPGPGRGARYLASPAGLAWRLQRLSLAGWTAGFAVLGAIYGSAADSIGQLLADNPQLERVFEQMGGTERLIDTFFSVAVGVIALVAAAYSIRTVLKLKIEEDSLRSELVLATATPRSRYAWSHLTYAIVGPVLVMAVAGLCAGAAYGAIAGDLFGAIPRVTVAAMAQLPAIWVLTGVAMALYGIFPRLSTLSWGVLAMSLIVGQLGQILQFPRWSLNLSPFSHIPLIPAEDFVATPFLILLAVATMMVVGGVAGFRSRDVPFS